MLGSERVCVVSRLQCAHALAQIGRYFKRKIVIIFRLTSVPDCRAPVLRHAVASDAPLCGVRRRRCRRRLWRIGGRLAAPITAAGRGFGPYRGINFDKCCADTPVHRTRACAAASPCGGGAPSECCNLVQMGARACAHTDTLPDASASEWGHTNLDIFWGWAQTRARARAAHVDCRRALHLIKNLSILPQNIVCVCLVFVFLFVAPSTWSTVHLWFA